VRDFHWIEVLGEAGISQKLARALLREAPPLVFRALVELFTNLLSGRCFVSELQSADDAQEYLKSKDAFRLAHFTQPSTRLGPSLSARKAYFNSDRGLAAIRVLLPVILKGCSKTRGGNRYSLFTNDDHVFYRMNPGEEWITQRRGKRKAADSGGDVARVGLEDILKQFMEEKEEIESEEQALTYREPTPQPAPPTIREAAPKSVGETPQPAPIVAGEAAFDPPPKSGGEPPPPEQLPVV